MIEEHLVLLSNYQPIISKLSIPNITVILDQGDSTIDTVQLRRVLSSNIKDRRKKLGISQEKLAEMTDLSVQMINSIEGQRAWVSDKTLLALSMALGIEVYQLFIPNIEIQKKERSQLLFHWLTQIQQGIKSDISADVDKHFERILDMNLQD